MASSLNDHRGCEKKFHIDIGRVGIYREKKITIGDYVTIFSSRAFLFFLI
jgi:hypothetical protein